VLCSVCTCVAVWLVSVSNTNNASVVASLEDFIGAQTFVLF